MRIQRATVVFSLCIAAASAFAGDGMESYRRARGVLDAGAAALGGSDALLAVKTIRRALVGDWVDAGQAPRPLLSELPADAVPPSHEHDEIVSVIDYGGNRWLELLKESNLSGDHALQIDAVTPEQGLESVQYIDERPLYQPFAADDLPALRIRKLRRYPEGLVRMALERIETLQYVGTAEEQGRPQEVVSFADALGARVLLYFDAETHLMTKSETLRDHPIAGDTTAEILYRDYRVVDTLTLPFRIVDRTAGVPTEDLRVTSVELNAAVPEDRFRAPAVYARVADDPAEARVERIGKDVYLIRGAYNVMFAAFRDFIVVLEAPRSGRYAEECIRRIRATVPGKPIRYVVATHFHYDHVAGIRSYIAAGATVVTTPDAKGVIERSLAARRTMRPDAASRAPGQADIEIVTATRVFDDGDHRLEVHDFGPTEHAAQLLVGYFPRDGILYEPDLLDVTSSELVLGVGDTVTMAERIAARGLVVRTLIPTHGLPATIETMEKALAVRAKYIPPPRPPAARPAAAPGEVIRDWVTNSRGDRLRVLVTRPAASAGPLPVIFFVGWLSCDSVEYASGETDGFGSLILRLIAQSGFATVRMDKPGVGESQGTRCGAADFRSELEGYQAAFAAMARYDFLDPDRVFVVGISNGGGVAPLVSGNHPVRGFVSAGSWGRTWYEHMLEYERRRLSAEGKSPAETDAAMKSYARFYDDYLIRKRLPGEILKSHPEWKALWDDAPDGQYGRPAAFYQQLQELNLGAAWQGVTAPVLVIHGSADEVMSAADSRAIAEHVNRSHPGHGRFVEIDGMTHGFTVRKQFQATLLATILDWMREQLAP